MSEDKTYKNEDIEIWREIPDDYYSPSIHKTKHGKIGINVGGFVVVRDVREWHRLAMKEHGCICETPFGADNDKCPVHYPLKNQLP